MSRKVINVVMGSSSNIKYYDVSSYEFSTTSTDIAILGVSILGKIEVDSYIQIAPNFMANFYNGNMSKIFAIGIDTTMKIFNRGLNQIETVEDFLKIIHVYDLLVSFPELTEEQFYDTTLPTE